MMSGFSPIIKTQSVGSVGSVRASVLTMGNQTEMILTQVASYKQGRC
ncbi:hypothetical protein MiSe_87420 [Microseira wollei NIES-4236]|uniref:Uncharacterized protein n=1 Tax=Microseira wollei NIES-4236 TaxID=2530354 RepID=A0AAV3XS81_9CYAN|nr:hypothetical protein MiSe_87420 [Microseira wollei NIES-4236]